MTDKKITRIVVFYDDNTYSEAEIKTGINLTPQPIPAPTFPYYPPGVRYGAPNWQWPHTAPGTVTCKMADGTTQEIQLTSPIVAQAKSHT